MQPNWEKNAMRPARIMFPLWATLASLLLCATAIAVPPEKAPGAKRLRVGTFDSRAVTAAYVASEPFNRQIKQLMEEHKKAKAAGDAEKVKQLEADGKARQDRIHQQGFGTASVADILQQIQQELPAIAKEAGVEVIVSKWDVAYSVPSAEFVDVTGLIIRPFNPNERTRRIVKELSKQPPIPLEKLRHMPEH